MKNIVIIGATSAIAQNFAELLAVRKSRFLLVGRNHEKLDTIKSHLIVMGAEEVFTLTQDIGNIKNYSDFVNTLVKTLGSIDLITVAHGTLPDQKQLEKSPEASLKEININALCTIGILTDIANLFEKQKSGVICVIGSVAGDRGRRSNYIYGTAKAMLATFCEGLRHRLSPFGIQVITIKPGFVDTPMTQSLPKSPLWAQPMDIAKGMLCAIEKHKNVVYLPFFWRYIMLIIKSIPNSIFNKMNI